MAAEKDREFDPHAVIKSLDADAIRQRLNEIDAESNALRALLRVACARDRRAAQHYERAEEGLNG
jgi:hypothetical protein